MIKKFFKQIPIGICGLALGLAALGNVLIADNNFTYTNPIGDGFPEPVPRQAILQGATIFRYILGVLSLICLLLFIGRLIADFKHVSAELKTPVPLSTLPTATMAMMLLAALIAPHASTFAIIVWFVAIALQLAIMVLFIWRFVIGLRKIEKGLRLKNVFPSWFIQAVGIVTASVTAGLMNPLFDFNLLIIGQIAFWMGFVLYFPTLVFVIARMAKVRIFQEPAKKTIAIFAAPTSLMVVGYFQAFQMLPPRIAGMPVRAPGVFGPNTVPAAYGNLYFFYFLMLMAVITYVFVLVKMISLLRIRYYPSYSAFTFPLVISALAFRITANVLTALIMLPQPGAIPFAPYAGFAHTELMVHIANFMRHFASFALILAIAACLFVLIHYVKNFFFWCSFSKKDKGTDIHLLEQKNKPALATASATPAPKVETNTTTDNPATEDNQ